MLTTQSQIRAAFWRDLDAQATPGKRQNDYPADVRMAWVDYVDMLEKSGEITEALAQRATL